jgi:hypothetical protein
MSERDIFQIMRQWADTEWCKAFGINESEHSGAFRLVDDCAHAANEIERLRGKLAEAQNKITELRVALAEEMSDEINVKLIRARYLLVKGIGYIDPIPDGRAEHVDAVRAFLAASSDSPQ